jgi:hypothetical protein
MQPWTSRQNETHYQNNEHSVSSAKNKNTLAIKAAVAIWNTEPEMYTLRLRILADRESMLLIYAGQ